MTDPHCMIPLVLDEDIEWVCGALNLREIDEPRQEFLRAHTTLDVSACPGSGKTTLIVAKLAIMARRWPHRTRGICVLSHTNAAREEIQRRLGGTGVSRQLLSYPHFIGTIHSFVNRFLALPWLNSNNFPSVTVDDDLTTAYRRRALTNTEYWKVQNFLDRKHSGFDRIRLADRELGLSLANGKAFPAAPNRETHQIAKRAVKASSNAGHFCYDEMFIWANALLEDHPGASTWLQRRFPLVIIDEMQDTSDLQAGILDAVFCRPSSKVALQRVGDPNQAIYDGVPGASATPGGYPDSANCVKIPKSFRFGPQIAALASPFAVTAVGPDGLQGAGPRFVRDAPESCSNAIFTFPDDNTDGVLDAYGHHVLLTFGELALGQGDVAAVGGRHEDARNIPPGHAHFPKTVSHYWSGYTAKLARHEPHPETLLQYVRVAQAVVRNGRDLSPGVEKLVSGLLRLARHAGGADVLGRRAAKHRTLMQALSTNVVAASAYRRLLRALLIDLETQTCTTWRKRQEDILLVAAELSGPGNQPDPQTAFLRWDDHEPSLPGLPGPRPQDAGPNVYRVEDHAGRIVDIRLGSVHSVKGQTHLATMLLNTYWHEHSSRKMLPWLLGEKVNSNGAKRQDQTRLLQTYVAMTRPSHLLCLAIPRSVLGDGIARPDQIAKLRDRGWAVAELIDGISNWLT